MKFVTCNRENQIMEYQQTKAACNFFLGKAKSEGTYLTPMKAIKLVYIAHGYTLALLNHPLIDDHVEVWRFGAVIPSLYHELKIYGSGRIKFLILDGSNVDKLDLVVLSESELQRKYAGSEITYDFNNDEKELMEAVWEVYKSKDGIQLSELIHLPNTPWDIIWNQKGGKYERGAIIPEEIIKRHYESITSKE